MKQIVPIVVAAGVLFACKNEPNVDQSRGSGVTVVGSGGSSTADISISVTGNGTVGGSGGYSTTGGSVSVADSGATDGSGFGGAAGSGGVTDTYRDGSIDQDGAADSGFETSDASRTDSSPPFDGGLGDSDPLFDASTDTTFDSALDATFTGAYQPCPTNGDPCKILPLGDSITWGWGEEDNGGYRGPLFALAVAAQQNITFTGSVENGPNTILGETFPKKNEGHNGWTISTANSWSEGKEGITSLIPSPAFDSSSGGMPNIILMMIGTNDTDDSTATEMSDELATLMDKIIDAAPEALLVVAKITPKSWTAAVVDAYNDAIPDLVFARAEAGKHVVLADMNTGFTAAMMSSDDLHPNREGYQFMADRWYSVIGSLLPK